MKTKPINLKIRHTFNKSTVSWDTMYERNTSVRYNYYEFDSIIEANSDFREKNVNVRIECPHCPQNFLLNSMDVSFVQCPFLYIKGSKLKELSPNLTKDLYKKKLVGLSTWIPFLVLFILFRIIIIGNSSFLLSLPLVLDYLIFLISFVLIKLLLSYNFLFKFDNIHFIIKLPKLRKISKSELDQYLFNVIDWPVTINKPSFGVNIDHIIICPSPDELLKMQFPELCGEKVYSLSTVIA